MSAEAAALLDSLMGGDRNAPLPPGTAPPRKRKKGSLYTSSSHNNPNQRLMLPTKRSKASCYDADICPHYCAWGIDLYDLFVNTKSDLGSNPNRVDDGARDEYLALPPHEQERLGFEARLFHKLQDLVRQCDRTVSRNKDKLQQELQRMAQKRNHVDQVEDIDMMAIDNLARLELDMENSQKEMMGILERLDEELAKESASSVKVSELRAKLDATKPTPSSISESEAKTEAKKAEESKNEGEKVEDEKAEEKQQDSADGEKKDEGAKVEGAKVEGAEAKDESSSEVTSLTQELETLEKEHHEIVVAKQRCLFDMARKMQTFAPLQEESNHRLNQLHYVKSDITSDKTVCEVSGNFMSARDADERIAAHYAGKQYIGWKLVRDKLKELQDKFGRYGPRGSGGGGGGHRGGSGGGGGYSGSGSRRDDRGGSYRGGSSRHGGGYGGGGGRYSDSRGGAGGYGGGGYSNDRGGYGRGGGGGRPGYGGRDRGRW